MSGAAWIFELVLMLLLAATLFHALRLERALGVLKQDRAALADLIAGFNASTQHAEAGISRLRDMADGAGRQIAHQAELASALKDDLVFLIERGTTVADRLDTLVRNGRQAEQPRAGGSPSFAPAAGPPQEPVQRLRSQAERDLLHALRAAR